jgi:hypothetical protein
MQVGSAKVVHSAEILNEYQDPFQTSIGWIQVLCTIPDKGFINVSDFLDFTTAICNGWRAVFQHKGVRMYMVESNIYRLI